MSARLIQCNSCQVTFEDFELDQTLRQRISPIVSGNRFQLPPPSLCPRCRRIRRALYCNDYKYYKRQCELCAKRIVSIHPPDAPYPVYCSRCWWSDSWNREQYALEIDWSRSFFAQFRELRRITPQPAMINDDGTQSENCEYCQNFAFGKNCYLMVGSWNDQDCLYSNESGYCREVVDCDYVNLECELVYESNYSTHLYNCAFLSTSNNCSDCRFCIDLKGCNNCFGCIGLRNQKFHIFNRSVSPEEYEKFISTEGDVHTQQKLHSIMEKVTRFFSQFPKRAVAQAGCDNCLGDGLFQCSNTIGFRLFSAQDSRYFYNGDAPKNCVDIDVSGKCEWCYECNSPDESYQCLFTNSSWRNRDVILSDQCYSSKNLLGCVGLERAENRIFNRKYSANEYQSFAAKILTQMQNDGSWGEFFPAQDSYFCYNETRAHEIQPLTQTEVLERGFRWREAAHSQATSTHEIIAEDIFQMSEHDCKKTFSCACCQRPYKIIPQELKFLKKMLIAAPQNCPDCRRRRRSDLRQSVLYQRSCACCQQIISSVFSEIQEKQVLCERCALAFEFKPRN